MEKAPELTSPRPADRRVLLSDEQWKLRKDLDDGIPPGVTTGEDAVTLFMRNKHREGQTIFLKLADRHPAIYEPFDLVPVLRSEARTLPSRRLLPNRRLLRPPGERIPKPGCFRRRCPCPSSTR